jgi:hypothetical protein
VPTRPEPRKRPNTARRIPPPTKSTRTAGSSQSRCWTARPQLTGRARQRERLAFDGAHDAVGAGADAAVEVALLEARRDVFVDDALRDQVREHAFEAVTNLDAQLAVVLRHDQERRVIHALAAELPRFLHAHRVLVDGLRLSRGHDQHRDLAALARLELG